AIATFRNHKVGRLQPHLVRFAIELDRTVPSLADASRSRGALKSRATHPAQKFGETIDVPKFGRARPIEHEGGALLRQSRRRHMNALETRLFRVHADRVEKSPMRGRRGKEIDSKFIDPRIEARR